jgi:hypothetical protein
MLVCKQWKVCALRYFSRSFSDHVYQDIGEAVLLENVTITSSLQLIKFKQRLCESDQILGRPIGHMVRIFTVEGVGGDSDNKEVWNSDTVGVAGTFLSIMLQMPRLQHYALTRSRWATNETDLLCLAIIAINLTSLDVTLDPGVDGVVPVLNKLRKLCWLALEFGTGPWHQSAEPPIRLLAVTHFTWTSYKCDKAMLTFLSRAHLAQECHMVLKLEPVNPDDMVVIQPLFDLHTIPTLQISLDSDSIHILREEIMRVPKVTFVGVVPQLRLWASPELPLEIVIQLRDDNGEKIKELFAVLHDLYMTRTRPLEHSTILKLELSDQPEWDWLERDASVNRALVVNLAPLAAPLYHRGIIVMDSNGRDVMCLTQR